MVNARAVLPLAAAAVDEIEYLRGDVATERLFEECILDDADLRNQSKVGVSPELFVPVPPQIICGSGDPQFFASRRDRMASLDEFEKPVLSNLHRLRMLGHLWEFLFISVIYPYGYYWTDPAALSSTFLVGADEDDVVGGIQVEINASIAGFGDWWPTLWQCWPLSGMLSQRLSAPIILFSK